AEEPRVGKQHRSTAAAQLDKTGRHAGKSSQVTFGTEPVPDRLQVGAQMLEEFQAERHPLIDPFDELSGEDGVLLEEADGVFPLAHVVQKAPETILRGVSL